MLSKIGQNLTFMGMIGVILQVLSLILGSCPWVFSGC